MLERIWMFGWHLVALAIFLGLMWFVARAHSHMWRQAAARYSRRNRLQSRARKLDSIVIAKRGASGGLPFGTADFRVYPIMIGIHDTGLSMSVIPPLNLVMCPPLFLSFDEMKLEETTWALWPSPYAIRMRQSPDFDIIVGRDTVRWVREYTDRAPFGLSA